MSKESEVREMADEKKTAPDRAGSETVDVLKALLNDNWENDRYITIHYSSKTGENC